MRRQKDRSKVEDERGGIEMGARKYERLKRKMDIQNSNQ